MAKYSRLTSESPQLTNQTVRRLVLQKETDSFHSSVQEEAADCHKTFKSTVFIVIYELPKMKLNASLKF